MSIGYHEFDLSGKKLTIRKKMIIYLFQLDDFRAKKADFNKFVTELADRENPTNV